MTIVYASICRVRDATCLVEATSIEYKGNVAQIMTVLVEHLRDHEELCQDGERKTFVHRNDASSEDWFSNIVTDAWCAATNTDLGDRGSGAEHYFHVYRKDAVFYCCLGDDGDYKDQKVNFAFLEHVQKEFTKMYRKWRIDHANAYGMNKNFCPTLRSAMHYHNINHDKLSRDQKIVALMAEVEDFKKVMGRNINMLYETHEHTQTLMDMSDNLTKDAEVFKKSTRKLKAHKSRQNAFMLAFCLGVVAIVIYFCTIAICGPTLANCKAPSQAQGNYDNNNYNNNNNDNNYANNANNNANNNNNNEGGGD